MNAPVASLDEPGTSPGTARAQAEVPSTAPDGPTLDWERPSLVAKADIDEIEPIERTSVPPTRSDYASHVAKMLVNDEFSGLDSKSGDARKLVKLAKGDVGSGP